ncbi:MAG: hypothetical protein M1820_008610 [Bogoriella megaspora]|nr:MAG: hypothetical protein M1820_008610 [Bogoriella megaspora]
MDTATPSETEDSQEPAIISESGDLVLSLRHEVGKGLWQKYKYRVNTQEIQRNSKYFDHLLCGPFVEAQKVSEALQRLRQVSGSPAEIPSADLPVLEIEDMGMISVSKSIHGLMSDFLRALHDQEMVGKVNILGNIANLTVVADRFDALEWFSHYVARRKLLRPKDISEAKMTEIQLRQKLFVGSLLDYEPWVGLSSQRLIIKGSARWQTDAKDEAINAAWWILPKGLEEELQYRRECILDTLSSLQAHFIDIYSSRERQCKLGYSDSLACDAFQLGEAIRWLSRVDLLRFHSKVYDVDVSPQIYKGDMYDLIGTLRSCPEYQINSNHSHCGFRTRLLPIVETIEHALTEVGICLECWEQRRSEHAWISTKRLPVWRMSGPLKLANKGISCIKNHAKARDMFTAMIRNWSARDNHAEDLHLANLSSGMKLGR